MQITYDGHDPSTNPAVATAICDPTLALFLIKAISEVGVKETHYENHVCGLFMKLRIHN